MGGRPYAKRSKPIVERVRELAQKSFSASVIADELGMSRNAVLGACHRYGVKLARGGARPNRLKAAKAGGFALAPMNRLPQIKPGKLPAPRKEQAPRKDADGRCLTLETAGFTDCRWITGQPTWDAVICGNKAKPGESWCAEHRRRVWTGSR
jgi:hypothetical protein